MLKIIGELQQSVKDELPQDIGYLAEGNIMYSLEEKFMQHTCKYCVDFNKHRICEKYMVSRDLEDYCSYFERIEL